MSTEVKPQVTTNGSPLPIAVVGCDFRVISSRWRSLLVLEEADALRMAADLRQNSAADGFVDVATCNRNEWLISSDQPAWAAELLRSWMLERLAAGDGPRIEPYRYIGAAAAGHVMRVAIGQESFVMGERQIASQVFRAMETARTRGTSSRILNGLGSIAARVVQSTRRRGLLAAATRGVHTLAVRYLRRARPRDAAWSVAVIGLGAIGRHVRALVEAESGVRVVACNRTVTPGQRGRVRPLSDLGSVLAEVDAALVCTGARSPVIGAEHLQKRPPGRPLLLIDLGIPEQVDRSQLPDAVVRVGLDELMPAGSGGAADSSEEVERLIRRATRRFHRFCHERDVRAILSAVQEQSDAIVGPRLTAIINERFRELPQPDRERLEEDLRGLMQSYTHQIFGVIKGAAVE